MLKNQPKDVVEAIKNIMKDSATKANEEEQVEAKKLEKKYEQMKPVNEIVGILKAIDKADKENQRVKKEKELVGNQHKLDKNKNGKLDAHDFKLLRKEEKEDESEIRDEKTKAVLKRAKAVHGKDVEVQGEKMKEETHYADVKKREMMTKNDKDKLAKVAAMLKKEKEQKMAKEEVEQADEAAQPGWMLKKDTNLAKRLKDAKKRSMNTLMKKFGGKTGEEIAKMRKEEVELEEGRGRPRKNPNDPKWQKKPADHEGDEGLAPDSGKEADQHIHVRLKQAADSSEKKGSDIKFDNGKTKFVHQHVAQNVLHALDKMKPDVRSKVHDHIQKSHENLMQVHTMLAGKK
jgi:hypothetical protein